MHIKFKKYLRISEISYKQSFHFVSDYNEEHCFLYIWVHYNLKMFLHYQTKCNDSFHKLKTVPIFMGCADFFSRKGYNKAYF